MKSKRAAAAASDGDKHIADPVVDEQSVKKRKRSDDDGETNGAVKKSKKDKKDKEKSKDKKKKKDHKGETRKEKKDKRKDLQNLPEGMEGGDEKADEAEGGVEVEAESKKEKKEKKTKAKEDKVNGAEEKDSRKKKDKKEKKEKKEKKQDSKSQEPPAAPSTDEKPNTTTNGTDDAIDLDASSARKPGRNIVFVGNLPFTATAATITAHFASLKPIAVRCLTNKGDTKATCKGIAFVEFGTPQQQRTCLDKFHHSTFEDGISPARKINVELTAGGGGKNQNRQDKIRQKNKKLDENRQKRIDTEKQEKLENNGGATKQQQQQQARMEDSIHPSRLARLPNLGQ